MAKRKEKVTPYKAPVEGFSINKVVITYGERLEVNYRLLEYDAKRRKDVVLCSARVVEDPDTYDWTVVPPTTRHYITADETLCHAKLLQLAAAEVNRRNAADSGEA